MMMVIVSYSFTYLFSLVPCREQEAKLEAAQKKLYLERKKKAIEKELKLDVEDSDKLIEDFKKKLETLQVPEEAMHVINEEMVPITVKPLYYYLSLQVSLFCVLSSSSPPVRKNKLTSLERSSSEYNITRTYLNWLTTLPWGLHSKVQVGVLNKQ
jgi:Lon-like ATP-dependent protease